MGPDLTDLPLRDIHLPSAIGWWPPAWGWWVIFAVFSLLILSSAILLIRMYLRPPLKKEASKALDLIVREFEENRDASQCLTQLSQFLRRVMLSLEREKSKKKGKLQMKTSYIGGVTGDAWLKLLDQSMGSDDFSKKCGKVLLTAPYLLNPSDNDAEDLIQLCRQWVKTL